MDQFFRGFTEASFNYRDPWLIAGMHVPAELPIDSKPSEYANFLRLNYRWKRSRIACNVEKTDIYVHVPVVRATINIFVTHDGRRLKISNNLSLSIASLYTFFFPSYHFSLLRLYIDAVSRKETNRTR